MINNVIEPLQALASKKRHITRLFIHKSYLCGSFFKRSMRLSFWHFVFFVSLTVSTKSLCLPQNYTVIAKETVKQFSFLEDQPWSQTPQSHEFHDFLSSGTVVILHFWATSCPSCVTELKALEELAAKRHKDPITIIPISLNDPRPGILRNYFMSNHYVHLKPYHKVSGSRPPIKGLPTTFFFNRSGYLVGKIEGVAAWNSEEMDRLLTRLCEEPTQQNHNQRTHNYKTKWSLSGLYDKLASYF